ncbi:homeodomain-interacting protein kinase 3-like isoform X1 [Trachinotus anak]|uniref:homeodomain-interacting protein kinase 3-like isoform X1 n=1 Tax=Trachinotus anak TaxID=443729 RepID=UPI0039F17190
MAERSVFEVISKGLIFSTTTYYHVEDLLGSGTFGVVVQCKKLDTNQTVALKIVRSRRHIEEAKQEEATLKMMKELDSHMFNIVGWNDSFIYEGLYCLEFEKLDISLHEFQLRSRHRRLLLKELRPVVQQLATALEFLKTVGIIHADLKPENIMMVDHLGQPLRVKVIDFGLACHDPEALTGVTLQSLWYRSPEILLGVSFSEAIDMWSLGCIAAEMFMGTPLFRARDEYDLVRQIVKTIGNPPDHLLDEGLYTERFFCADESLLEPLPRRLMSSLEVTNFAYAPCKISSLNDLMEASYNLSGEDSPAVHYDQVSFVDLLRQMLMVDAGERITPSHALQHPFITTRHLVSAFNHSSYVKSCIELMNACEDLSSDSGEDVAQTTTNTCLTEEATNSSASPAMPSVPCEAKPAAPSSNEHQNSPTKRKRDAAADDECGNSPGICPAKRGRTHCWAETSGRVTTPKSALHKRKWEDEDFCNCSPAKRRSKNLVRELTESVNKLISSSEGAQSSSSKADHLKRRKRDDEEASSSDQTATEKRRRGSQAGGEW